MNATSDNLPDYVSQGEARAAAALVNALIAAGYALSVHDGEEFTVKQSVDAAEIAKALASTDYDSLRVRDPRSTEHPESGRSTAAYVGSILLVWGNAPDGSELVSDWSWDGSSEAGRAFNAWMDARL